jgi:LysR family glycine cleavage system transcriptional activator
MQKRNEVQLARRLTPPISALAAFEAVARRGSFTAAAQELSLTQSAISRQINALESLLGVPLFERNRRKQVVLTPSGSFYVERVRQMLSSLAAATTEAIALSGRGRALRLGIPPTFGSRWLVPRMPGFFAAHPDITVEFTTRIPFRPHAGLENLDALIDFAAAPGTDGSWHKLLEQELRVVAAPSLAKRLERPSSADIAALHLLVHLSERKTLPEVFTAPGLHVFRSHPMLTFESYTMLFQAAAAGLGIALAPMELIETELSTGSLVPISDLSIKSKNVGYLVHEPEKAGYPPLKAFRDWLFASVASARAPSSVP